MRKLKLFRLNDWLFRQTIGRLAYYRTFAPGIDILPASRKVMQEALAAHYPGARAEGTAPTFLDIGARGSEWASIAQGYEYVGMDINPRAANVIAGDICACPEIADNSFDVVFSVDVFEHLQRPWDAARECVRIVKPGGLLIHRTVFAYRYHPSPIDFWRFSSQGLEYLFASTGQVETLVKGYDITSRRADNRGNASSKPPVDYLGGFRENWRTLFIGRKNG